jgi:PKD repeat protein
VSITDGTGGGLAAKFTYSPSAPAPGATVSFDSATSTGSISSRIWDFGDGSPITSGAQVTHTFAASGAYTVKLSVTGPGNCPPAPFCESTSTQVVTVINSNPGLVPSFTSPVCVSELSLTLCKANTGDSVVLTDTSSGPVASRSWSFGDGGTATGSPVTHVWEQPGIFTVTLTIGDGTNTSQKSQVFNIEGEPVPTVRTLVIPWISQTTAPLLQTSDLFLHNPGTAAEFTLTFRKRGTPEVPAPTWKVTLGEDETLYVSDVLDEKFDRVNVSGSLQIEGNHLPVAISFNQTFGDDGSSYGQAVPGVPPSELSAEVAGAPRHVIGLNDNTERYAYFGVSNPTDSGASFRARIYRRDPGTGGAPQLIALTPTVPLAAHGMKQYPVSDLRELGVVDQSDYRVEVDTLSGDRLIPFGANLRIATEDPAFTLEGTTESSTQYFLGALRKPGLTSSVWVTQAVLFNPADQPMPVSLRFVHAGLGVGSEDPVTVTLAPGETQRMLDPLFALWGLTDSAGVVVVESVGVGGVYPAAQLETFDDQLGDDGLPRRYGQYVASRNASHVATGNRKQILVGLRSDEQFRSVLFLFSPSGAHVDLVYRSMEGAVLGTLENFPLSPGGARQVSPSQHPLPTDFTGRFTVEVRLRDGDVLSAAQVVNNANNDPAYITGESR